MSKAITITAGLALLALSINAYGVLQALPERYNLVSVYMGEADIIDHDLTREDCTLALVAYAPVAGQDVRCEASHAG